MIARGLILHRQAVSPATREGNELARQLLGIEPSGYFEVDKFATLAEQTPSTALPVALAVVLGEVRARRQQADLAYPSPIDADYFLSEVE